MERILKKASSWMVFKTDCRKPNERQQAANFSLTDRRARTLSQRAPSVRGCCICQVCETVTDGKWLSSNDKNVT
jgi:hypothetical protein